MTETTKTLKIYTSDDGMEFMDKEKCLQHESRTAEMREKMRFFRVFHSPDLNETGNMTRSFVLAVYSAYGVFETIAEKYITDVLGIPALGPSVMGYGFQRHFYIQKCSDGYDEVRSEISDGHVVTVLCPWEKNKFIFGLLDPDGRDTRINDKVILFDYMKEWGYK